MLSENQISLSKARLETAKEDLLTAAENMRSKRYKTANNRAYYSMFHAIRALLALDGVDFKTHSQVVGYFNKNYIHKGYFESDFGKIVITASTDRNKSDYEDFYTATLEEAEKNVRNAKKMLEAIERYIEARLESEHVQESFELNDDEEDNDEDNEGLEP